MKKNNCGNIDNLIVETNDRKFQVETIFIDLDGTLLDRWNKKISKKNIEAIWKIQKFANVVISTGRSYSKKVKAIIKMFDLRYAICQNGAIIVNNNGDVLRNITLDEEQVQYVVDKSIKNKMAFTINSEFLIYTNRRPWTLLTYIWNKKWKKIKDFSFKENFINKIVIAGYLKRKKIWALASEIKNKLKNASVKTSGNDLIIEVTNKEATKGKAAIFVSNLLGTNIHNSIHIGDSENDSTTLNKVGALIAMKDSSKKLLNIATHIGPKHKKSGVAKLLSGCFVINNK